MDQAQVDYNGKDFIVVCPYWDNERVKQAPDRRWDKTNKWWVLPATSATVRFLEQEYDSSELLPSTILVIDEIKSKNKVINSTFPSWYKFTNPPHLHQIDCLNKAWGKDEFAMFMWMGRGKTFTVINLVSAYVMNGDVNALLVVCPSGVKPVWPMEWEKHSTIPADFHVMESGYKDTVDFIMREADFKVMVVGIEALSQGDGHKYATMFVEQHKVFMTIDESSDIKNPYRAPPKNKPKAKGKGLRTKRCWDLGGLCVKRVIMTGTEVTEGVENLFSQYRFLNWQIIGHKSYYTFKNRYCIVGGFQNKKIVGYTKMKELMGLVEPYTFSIGKDVEGLPEKIMMPPLQVKSTPAQKKAFADLKTYEYAEMEGHELITETILERTLRYQQICGGFFPFDVEGGGHDVIPIPGKNPKLEALKSAIEDISSKAQMIIWANFLPEIYLIEEELKKLYGPDSVDLYIGGSTTDKRIEKIKRFQAGGTRFMLANKTASRGTTLTAATYNYYYSNTYSYETRLQSEERSHRDGQKHPVVYQDIIIDHPVERRILKALENKQDLAMYVKRELGAFKYENI